MIQNHNKLNILNIMQYITLILAKQLKVIITNYGSNINYYDGLQEKYLIQTK